MEDQEYVLVKCRRGVNRRQVDHLISAFALFRDVECVFPASTTGLSQDRLDVITGKPTPATVQRRVRRKVSLAG